MSATAEGRIIAGQAPSSPQGAPPHDDPGGLAAPRPPQPHPPPPGPPCGRGLGVCDLSPKMPGMSSEDPQPTSSTAAQPEPGVDIKPRSRDVTDGIERAAARGMLRAVGMGDDDRSEEHTSELQSH